jgi:hypothetical protein
MISQINDSQKICPSMMDPIVRSQIDELKGYVDGCIDAYQDRDGIPFAVMETIQKKVETISLGIREQVDP